MTFAGCPLWNCGRHRDLPLPDDCLPLQGLPNPPHNHLRPLLTRWGDRHLLPPRNGRQSASTDSEVSSSCAASHQLLFIVFSFLSGTVRSLDQIRPGGTSTGSKRMSTLGWFPPLIPNVFNKHSPFRYLETDEKLSEGALEKLMLPRVISHVSMQSQSIV